MQQYRNKLPQHSLGVISEKTLENSLQHDFKLGQPNDQSR